MSKRILHISHHIGCFKDQAYILNKLGYSLLNFKFYDNRFTVDRQLANDFWQNYKDTINSYDFVLISDTSSISRCILQNFSEFKSRLIIWICNRFDYGMQGEREFYELFNAYKDHERVKIVSSTLWEHIWCLKNNIDILNSPIIKPLGKFCDSLNKYVPDSNVYRDWYTNNSKLIASEVFVPFYHNDNSFFKLSQFLRAKNISVCNTTFKSVKDLSDYKAIITLPDTFCKWLSFETIHEKIPVILPSLNLLEKLCKQSNYIFNMTGYGGAELMSRDLLELSEWYNNDLKPVRFYFNSFEEIPYILQKIKKENMELDFVRLSEKLEQDTLNKWREIYEKL